MLFSLGFMLRRASIYLWVFVVFAASEWLARYLGVRFASETLGTLYQYLDPEILEGDLLRGLYYLHAQPPLYNLFLGVVLKLFPQSYEAVFSALYGAMALGMLLGMAWLMRRFQIPDGVSGVVIVSFALSPNFPVYRHWLFYTLPVAFLLVVATVALTIYLDKHSRAALAAFLGCVLAVMLTRSVFHPLWLIVAGGALLPFVERRKTFAIACTAPLLVVCLLFLKNYALVGSFTGSTWLGLSLTKRWPLSQQEVAELKSKRELPEFWQRRPFQEPSYYERFGFFRDGSGLHEAIDAPYESNGSPNFNHRDYVVISNQLAAANSRLIVSHPDRYLRRVLTALLLYLQPGPNSVHFLVDYDFERVHRYRDLWTQYGFLGGRVERPIRMLAPPANVWMLLFPLVLIVGTRAQPRGPFVFMLVTIVWVTAVTNLIEIGENDRMRWEVEPLLAILFAFATSRILLFLRRLKGS
jgi:hypothetical protein